MAPPAPPRQQGRMGAAGQPELCPAVLLSCSYHTALSSSHWKVVKETVIKAMNAGVLRNDMARIQSEQKEISVRVIFLHSFVQRACHLGGEEVGGWGKIKRC